jgi:hypothetical protein
MLSITSYIWHLQLSYRRKSRYQVLDVLNNALSLGVLFVIAWAALVVFIVPLMGLFIECGLPDQSPVCLATDPKNIPPEVLERLLFWPLAVRLYF